MPLSSVIYVLQMIIIQEFADLNNVMYQIPKLNQ